MDLGSAAVIPVQASGGAGAIGAGDITLPVPIPNAPALIGLTTYWQRAFVDAGGSAGWSHTNGLAVTIGQEAGQST